MTRFALVKDGVVEQWVEVEDVMTYVPPEGFYLVDGEVARGMPTRVVERQQFVYPYDFIDLFTLQELSEINQSTDAIVIKFRTKLQTMLSQVDRDSQDLIDGLMYLTFVGLLAPGRAEQLRGL